MFEKEIVFQKSPDLSGLISVKIGRALGNIHRRRHAVSSIFDPSGGLREKNIL